MTKQFKSDNASTPQQAGHDVLGLIRKMHQQLVFLEKKIDILISHSLKKSFREKSFSKPFRSFGRPGHPNDRRTHDEGFIERSFPPGHHFEKRRGDEHRKFGGPQKSYSDDREDGSMQERHFKKKYGGQKKKFFYTRKD